MTKNNETTEELNNISSGKEVTKSSHENNKTDYEVLFNKEKKKGTVFLILTIALTILFFGALAWGISESNEKPKYMGRSMDSKMEQGLQGKMGQKDRMMESERGEPGEQGRGMMRMKFDRFLNEDGSVDTQEVKEFVRNMPANAKENFTNKLNDNLDQAVKDGKITQDQANALKNAIIN